MQQRERPRLQQQRASRKQSVVVELPRLVACLGGCGFWGNPATKNLCHSCFSTFLNDNAQKITREQAIQDMLEKLGFSSMEDYMFDLAFNLRFPERPRKDSVAGVRQWTNTARPLTQFDKAPERGTTACTFVSGVTALRALLRNEFAEGPAEWADCILRGVVAFHAAAKTNPHLKGHSHICEAMPYIFEVLGCTPAVANSFSIKERIVVLNFDAAFEGSRPSDVLGSNYADGVGKEELVSTLQGALREGCALVITRPPETWAVTLERHEKTGNSRAGGTVRMRDSHRRMQFDFESVAAFTRWIAAESAYFAAVPSLGINMNSVSISWFCRGGRAVAPKL